jgi:hypothetical protein
VRFLTGRRARTTRASIALCAILIAGWIAPASPSAADVPSDAPADTVDLPGDAFFPESIAAPPVGTPFLPAGTLFVSSIVTGEIVRIPSGAEVPQTFVPAGGDRTYAGILVDLPRRVLWACGVDVPAFQNPTVLRAFDLGSGNLLAEYPLPDQGVCADIALARGDVYVTDTSVPFVADPAEPPRPGRILRLRTSSSFAPAPGALTVWSDDPALTGPNPGLQVNGIASDGRYVYTSNYGTGELLRVRIRADGSAAAAERFRLEAPFTFPDGIRLLAPSKLLVAENVGRLSLVDVSDLDVEAADRVVVSDTVDQPSSVVRAGRSLWVSEGQILRLQSGEPPHLPFKVRRLPIPWHLL